MTGACQDGGMVTLLLDSAHLEVALSASEKLASLQRENVRLNRADITKVQLTEDPWTWIRGVRTRGTHVPGVLAAGVWRSVGGADFVMVRGRKKPGVVIDLTHDAPFQRVIITTQHSLALVEALQIEIVEHAADVVTLTSPIPVVKPRKAPRPATA